MGQRAACGQARGGLLRQGGSVSQSVSERLRKEGIEIDVASVMEKFDSDQEWLQTLMGNNQSYSPGDIRT
jgi:hypothetical protein